MSKKTFAIISLGCFRNTYDSQIVVDRFLKTGFKFKQSFKNVQTLVINTCGFIDKAKQESIAVIRDAINLKNKGKIKELFVFGCLVKRYREDFKKSFPEVDRWWSVEDFNKSVIQESRLLPAHIGFLKICEGCRNKCSFCAIPLIKGKFRSKPQQDVIREAKVLDKKGVKEISIIGQDVTSWGYAEGQNLAALIKSILCATKNVRWVRLIYAHPRHISDDLIDLISEEERICKYIDLPIQHINDRILKLMNRQTTKKEITSLIKRIRAKIPNCVIRTSIIVGFPTEKEEEFKELLDFISEVKFDRVGAFTYSREEGTSAYNFSPQIHYATKKRRFNELMSLQKRVVYEVNKRFIGQELDVLVERKDNNVFVGRTEYDAYQVDGEVFLNKKGLKIGQFYKAKIIDTYEYDLVGI